MIIFLYGPDDYRRAEKKREIIAEFKKKRGSVGLESFDFDTKEDVGRFQEFLRNESIFQTTKFAVIENAFELEAKKLVELLKPVLEDKTTQVLVAEKDKPVKALAFLLEKPALSQKFEHLAGVELASFINLEAKKNHATLSSSAAQFLAAVYQNNSWGLVTELQKIGALKSSIDKKDLDELDLEAAPNYWALMNGLKSYDMRNRLYALEKLFSMNDPAPKIFNIIAAQSGEKTPHMAAYDIAIKSGKLEYEEALVSAVLD